MIPKFTIFIILIDILFHLKAKKYKFIDKYSISLRSNNLFNIITSGFIFSSGNDFFISIILFYLFGIYIEPEIGQILFLISFFTGLIAGNIFSFEIVRIKKSKIYIHGQMGGVVSIMTLAYVLKPYMGVTFLPLLLPVFPGFWFFLFIASLPFIRKYLIPQTKKNLYANIVLYVQILTGMLTGFLVAFFAFPLKVLSEFHILIFTLFPITVIYSVYLNEELNDINITNSQFKF